MTSCSELTCNNPNRLTKDDTLLTAIYYCHPKWALSLIRRGADPNVIGDDGRTAIINAASLGSLAVVKALLQAGADPHARDHDGDTALLYAAGNGHVDVIDTLIAAGADVNAVGMSGYTALIWAAAYGGIGAVKSLIGYGANINAIDDWGQSALSKALGGKDDEVVATLRNSGAVLIPSTSTMMSAAFGGHADVVAELLDLGVDPNEKDSMGYTSPFWAMQTGDSETVLLLKGAGALEPVQML